MRALLQGDETSGEFTKTLLQIGDGRLTQDKKTGEIQLPFGNMVQTINQLQESVYPEISFNYLNHNWLCERTILATTNETVNEINLQMLQKIPGLEHEYKSMDNAIEENDLVQYPIESLNKIESPQLQPHKLKLKIGAPIILLRNIDMPKLCNGTKLIITQLFKHIIQAKIMTGSAKGEEVFIPRMPIIYEEGIIHFKRIQFPIRLCFAMTINKSQGQSLKIVGIDLRSPCFAHGQLYVACSRVGKASNLYILTENGKTKNIINHRALQ